ncbi:hypothetical protein Nepgr_005928 [Nepenthes gracilis]|uniref:Survival protein SurE-like phosphatase/nucleotidase domain-containing protein n=1 Tax=Nepenthes gracilis TaxID=150966 RepID=A0AAD3S4F4_NEPGR|nr:hypothetical protein Nepgr_005928 [Nepenthes gracilis]
MDKNALPHSLVANLQQVLISRNKEGQEEEENDLMEARSSSSSVAVEADLEKKDPNPIVLVTNGDGIGSHGLACLVDGLARSGRFDVRVCAPQSDKSACSHSLTIRETVEVSSAEISGATAYEVSGTPADCVSLALSEALFSSSKPVLVISGINRGSSCGQNTFYSGALAAAREALICGVPSLCISLNWKKDLSSENDYKDAVIACLPLIHAVTRDIERGVFPKGCLLNIEIPVCPSANKGFRVTRQSLSRSGLSWQAVSAYQHPAAGHFMSSQQSLGIQLARLGRDASAAGAARRLNTNRKNVEIESVGLAGKPSSQQAIRKFYRLEFQEKNQEDGDEDLDFIALEKGFVTITPIALSSDAQSVIQSSVSSWLENALSIKQ